MLRWSLGKIILRGGGEKERLARVRGREKIGKSSRKQNPVRKRSKGLGKYWSTPRNYHKMLTEEGNTGIERVGSNLGKGKKKLIIKRE